MEQEFNLRLEIDVKVKGATYLAAASAVEQQGFDVGQDVSEAAGIDSIHVEQVRVIRKKPRKIDPNACESTDKGAKG